MNRDAESKISVLVELKLVLRSSKNNSISDKTVIWANFLFFWRSISTIFTQFFYKLFEAEIDEFNQTFIDLSYVLPSPTPEFHYYLIYGLTKVPNQK